MTFTSRIYKASFRGIPFSWISEKTEGGQKIALHEYVNSDKRFAEPLGKKSPIFTIEALLHGINVINQRIAFEDALTIPGLGKLIHPIYGNLNVTVLDFVVSSLQSNLGQVIFSIRFAITEPITPQPVIFTKTALVKTAQEAREQVDSLFEETWIDPVGTRVIVEIGEKAQDLWKKIQTNINVTVNLIEKKAAEFNKNVRATLRNVYNVIDTGKDIKDGFKLILDSALAAAQTPSQLKTAWENLTQENILPVDAVKTVNDARIAQNNSFLVEYLRLNALVNSYESAVFSTFTTDVELEETKTFLNNNYQEFLIEVVTFLKRNNLISITEDDVRLQEIFNNLRTLAQILFDEQNKNVYQIKEVETEKTSLILLTYKYYGSLDLLDEMISLNPDINHANFQGKVKILTK